MDLYGQDLYLYGFVWTCWDLYGQEVYIETNANDFPRQSSAAGISVLYRTHMGNLKKKMKTPLWLFENGKKENWINETECVGRAKKLLD